MQLYEILELIDHDLVIAVKQDKEIENSLYGLT